MAAFREHERSDSDYDSDDQATHARQALSDIVDFGGVDIYTDQGWDTDLEQEGMRVNFVRFNWSAIAGLERQKEPSILTGIDLQPLA